PQQDAVRAIFVSLSFLQKELDQEGRVNTILVSRVPGTQPQTIAALLKDKATLEDLGLKLRVINDQHSISVESAGKIINEHVVAAATQAAQSLSLRTVPVLSYLANSINDGEHSTPYSLVTALDDEKLAKLAKVQAS